MSALANETLAMRPQAAKQMLAEINTKRLILRACTSDDADEVLAGLSNYEVARMVEGASLPLLRPDAIDWLDQQLNNGTTFALTLDGKRAIGLVQIAETKNAFVLKYWLNRHYWGQGYMVEALDAVLGQFFIHQPDAHVLADVYRDDVPALHLQQRLGFRTKGYTECFSTIRGAMVLKIQMILDLSAYRKSSSCIQ